MKDITRIHIAKVPYSIELTAKKNLEKYINALELYTGDHEVLEDIEIRMTELLLERGVKHDAVISDADVTAIRGQLGEPKDFMLDDEDEAIAAHTIAESAPRKLYRNLDSAVLGGVLSGIASYFRINALWVRLVFITLTLMSFGLLVLLYVVLWLIVPPARTAAEKLQMAGRPVTLTSIRELNESGSSINVEKRARVLKRVATTIVGIGGLVGAFASAATLTMVSVELVRGGNAGQFASVDAYKLSIIFAFVAGILLTILFLLIAFAAFAQKFTKRIWVSGIIIIVLGLAASGTALVLATYQGQQLQAEIQRNTVQASLTVPVGFAAATSLSVDVPDGTSVVYVADDTHTSLTQRMVKGSKKANVTVQNNTIKVHLDSLSQNELVSGSTITIYGPQLEKIIMSNGYVSYNSANQTNLSVEVYNSSSLRLIGSRIDTLSIKTDGTAQLSAGDAAVSMVKASVNGQSSVELGNIKSLIVTSPDVCAANQIAQLSVNNSIASTYTYNGIERSATSSEGPCLRVEFESDQGGGYGYRTNPL